MGGLLSAEPAAVDAAPPAVAPSSVPASVSAPGVSPRPAPVDHRSEREKSAEAGLERAVSVLHRAISADKAGKLKEAFDLYESALSIAVPVLEDLAEPRKSTAKASMVAYLTRAEELKAALSTPRLPGGTPRSLPGRAVPPSLPARTTAHHGGGGGGAGAGGADHAGRPGVRGAVGGVRGGRGLPPAGVSPGTSELSPLEEEILSETLDASVGVRWSDIAGLQFAKEQLQEAVIKPSLRPDLCSGLRAPPKGVLLFGPPGTGKTMIAKAVATESGATFFALSASSLMSKWLGEGEKRVRALFSVAAARQPSVIFIDEVDSILSKRSDNENEASRRMKTEFMVQIEGASSDSDRRVFFMGATNRPWEIDDAMLRRFSKRIYIPLPDAATRSQLIENLLRGQSHNISAAQMRRIVDMANGYSGSDLAELCREAARLGVRRVAPSEFLTIDASHVDPISFADFETAFRIIRPSVAPDSLRRYTLWSEEYGIRG